MTCMRDWRMRLIRFKTDGVECYGVLGDDEVEGIEGDVFLPGKETGDLYGTEEIEFLSPIDPGKVICIGFNYRAHMDEIGDIATMKPTLTLKSQNSVTGHKRDIILPRNSSRVEHEAELGIVVGRGGYQIENPIEHILGYTIVNDVTDRSLEREMTQWSAAKSFPTFCPIGPAIETELNPGDLRIRCLVNDEVRQDSQTSLMIYDVYQCVRFVSNFMRLEKGDLIATGTVPGVGVLRDRDVVKIEIEDIGILENYCRDER